MTFFLLSPGLTLPWSRPRTRFGRETGPSCDASGDGLSGVSVAGKAQIVIRMIKIVKDVIKTTCLSLQILDSQDFEEFPSKPLNSMRTQDSPPMSATGLESLGQELELELGPGTGAGVASGSKRRAGEETRAPPLDPETKRRLSLQEPRTSLDSRTPQRHSSDPGGEPRET